MSEMSENIFLFVPNIIGEYYVRVCTPTYQRAARDTPCAPRSRSRLVHRILVARGSDALSKRYARIGLALIAFYFMPTDHVTATWCYCISGLLDAFDGHAARFFNQSTKFGAMLDQLTDRCGTLGLLMVLSTFYPRFLFLFQLSTVIDIAGHWIHVQASLMQGKTSHKFVDVAENPIMNLYYTSKPVLFFFCFCNEMFYCLLYLLYFTEGPLFLGFGLFRILLYVSAPFSLIKSGITVLHMYLASINLGGMDVTERNANEKSD